MEKHDLLCLFCSISACICVTENAWSIMCVFEFVCMCVCVSVSVCV